VPVGKRSGAGRQYRTGSNDTPLTGSREKSRETGQQKECSSLYNDRTVTCADCSQEFVFSASEQQFYADRGFSDPRRCPSCRQARKAARVGGGSDYASAGSYGGGGGSYGGGGGGYRERGPREMFEATCSNCGKTANVPFRPTSGKPVFCDDCFASRRRM
jgi:CxxC-x17-CxxC domain-containing protein